MRGAEESGRRAARESGDPRRGSLSGDVNVLMVLAPVFTVVSRWGGEEVGGRRNRRRRNRGEGRAHAPVGAARSSAAIQAVSIARDRP